MATLRMRFADDAENASVTLQPPEYSMDPGPIMDPIDVGEPATITNPEGDPPTPKEPASSASKVVPILLVAGAGLLLWQLLKSSAGGRSRMAGLDGLDKAKDCGCKG